ncbi:protein of unknown function [Taphrina deformans PYCC 5710]|uniref:Uncharacterized protein n=1 Tax=Taphrina deformans (strain PYCC 5710 / ATCC 11124 / CBS 356.35 / IMI 108563 / JCM 9778 / NBRC 8474) TaxID=1097556 RepID=R4X9H7_TAPDE|nr:protein of unknown function [Taphrina deformans PYCC 5710]|eukprot:CCG82406.1 protein of unknown function [Taphrina deformans PYCC 5710]
MAGWSWACATSTSRKLKQKETHHPEGRSCLLQVTGDPRHQMHVKRLDKSYRSNLTERERKRHPYPVNYVLQDSLATQTLNKTDFAGSKLTLADKTSAVDVVRSATNLFNSRICRLAREIEAHIDLSADCREDAGPTSFSSCNSSNSSRSSVATTKLSYRTFDDSVEGYLNLIAGTLTVIIERGTNKMLCEAVEAVIAHLSFIDTIKLSLLRPLLTTYSTNERVDLVTTNDGTFATFRCLLGHDVPSIGLFSNISTVLALENVITAPCLRSIFFCYWSCLHANLGKFKHEIAACAVLNVERRDQYVQMLRVALSKVEAQETRLSLEQFIEPSSCPDFIFDHFDTDSILSESTQYSFQSASESDTDSTSVASDPVDTKQPLTFRYLSSHSNFPKLSPDSGRPSEKKSPWNSFVKPLRRLMETKRELALF